MKKLPLFVLLPLAILSSGCSNKTQFNVFAAASMTETLNQIKEAYEKEHSDIELKLNFESSGTLLKQIQNGADCDLFISAAPKQMNALQEAELLNNESRINLLENKVALVVPDGNPKSVTSFANLKDRLLAKEEGFKVAIGDKDVPVGQYTEKIMAYYQIDMEEHKSMFTLGSNVKVVTTTVKEAGAACGIVYQTDAKSANLTVVDTATKDMCGQVIYPAATLKNAKQLEEATKFLEYLKGEEASKVFEDVGFTALNK